MPPSAWPKTLLALKVQFTPLLTRSPGLQGTLDCPRQSKVNEVSVAFDIPPVLSPLPNHSWPSPINLNIASRLSPSRMKLLMPFTWTTASNNQTPFATNTVPPVVGRDLSASAMACPGHGSTS